MNELKFSVKGQRERLERKEERKYLCEYALSLICNGDIKITIFSSIKWRKASIVCICD